MTFVWAFLVGGALCLLAQLTMDLFRLTPAHVLVGFVVAGGVAGALGLYDPLVKLAGAGATVPLPGFGYALVKGVVADVKETGALGLFTGAFKAAAAGIKAAIIFGFLAALFFRPSR